MADAHPTTAREGSAPTAEQAPSNLYQGYDAVAIGMLSTSAATGAYEKTGGRSQVHIKVCESAEEVAEALEIDASVSVSYLKIASATAKMSFMKKLNITSHSVAIVVYASHHSGRWSAKNAKLQDTVTPPEDDNSAADFVASYGDSFINAVTLGGEYYAVYTFRTQTRTEQSSLSTSLKASGIYAGVSAEVDIQTKLSNFMSNTETNWTFDQEVTGIENPVLPSQDGLIEYAISFPSRPIDSPVVTNITTRGYESLMGAARRKFAKVAKNRGYFVDPDDGLLKSLAHLTAVKNQITWLKRIYARYNYQGDTDLLAFEREVNADIKAINGQVDDWEIDATTSFTPPPLSSIDKGEPVLQFDVPQPPAWGGSGGSPFQAASVGEAIKNQVRITGIRLAGGTFVDRIEVDYASDKRTWQARHGGDGGASQQWLRLEDGQFPKRFVLRSGILVDWLKIYLTDGRTTEVGGPGGNSADWQVGADEVVLGFAGRAGSLIDQLQIIYAKSKPAKYIKPF